MDASTIILVGIAMVVLYLMPTIMALHRQHPNILLIFVMNLLLGWTVILWTFAFIWAESHEKPKSL